MKKHLQYFGALLLCCLLSSAKGQEIVLKAGDLTEDLGILKGYPDYTPLSSFQVGIQAETSWTKGGGASVGKPNPLAIEITKAVDAFSNQLAFYITTGKAFPTIEILWLMPNTKGDWSVAQKIELTGAFITEVMNSSAEGCTSNCPLIAESYKMVYKTIKRTIYKPDKDGNYKQVNVWTWDIPAGNSHL